MGSPEITPQHSTRPPTLRRVVAVTLGATLAAGGLALAPVTAAPATAAPATTEQAAAGDSIVFKDSRGTEWTVPAGVDEVLVGLRGGKGGDARPGRGYPDYRGKGGKGEIVVVSIPVIAGDVLTLYAGKDGDDTTRAGGAGFVSGASGGGHYPDKHDVIDGGGGGGAAAVKLNSVLVAVAAGGGGGGGAGTYPGGNGGSQPYQPENGGGPVSSAGVGGRNGSPTSDQEKAPSAGTDTFWYERSGNLRTHAGGPGGGGGGGWPASGIGGDKGFWIDRGGAWNLRSAGGGGGGAGLGMIAAPATALGQSQLPVTGSFDPFAKSGEVKVTVPLTTEIQARALSTESEMGEPLKIVIETRLKGVLYSQTLSTSSMGEVRVKSGGEVVFSQPVTQRSSILTATIASPQTPGDYEYEVEYLPPYDDDNPLQEQGASRTNINNPWVERVPNMPTPEAFDDASEMPSSAVAPLAAADAADEVVISPTSTTIASAPSEVQAHQPFNVTAQVVTPQADPDLDPLIPTGEATLTADGLIIGNTVLDPFGRAVFTGVVAPWGTTQLAVQYEGDFDMHTFTGFERSESDPSEIVMTEAQTITELEFSETDLLAGEETIVRARVTGADLDGIPGPDVLEDPRGQIELLADGEVIGAISVAFDADPEADDAEAVYTLGMSSLPPGAHNVIARFVPANGFAGSESAPAPVNITPWDTTLTATPDTVTATPGTPVTIKLAATAVAPDSHADTILEVPMASGSVQAYLDDIPLGDPTRITDGVGELSFAEPPATSGEMELQFTPSKLALSQASASVKFQFAGGAANAGSNTSGQLARTGAEIGMLPIWGVGLLLAAAGASLVLGRAKHRRRATNEKVGSPHTHLADSAASR